MMTDPIADMLTRIRNAVRVEKQFVDLPFSNLKKNIAEVMKREGYIRDYQIVEAQPVNIIRIQLKYGPNGEKVIRHIQRVSKPGCRVYSSAADLKPVLNGLGVSVVSTSKGLLSDREAKNQQVGGEIICEIW